MIIATNYKNENNNLSISVAPSIQLESIITTITGRVDGFAIHKKYYNFSQACKAYKKLEKEFGQIGKY